MKEDLEVMVFLLLLFIETFCFGWIVSAIHHNKKEIMEQRKEILDKIQKR